MRNKSQKGFSVVEMLLVVIALTLVVGVGYYIYHSNKKDDNITKKSSIAQSTTSPQAVSTNYLEIKELGVKIPLSSDIADIKYSVLDDGIIEISSPNQEAQFKKDGCADEGSSSGGSIASVTKKSGTFKKESDFELFKQFNNFNLSGQSTITACQDPQTSDDMSNNTYTTQALSAYKKVVESFKNAQEL